MRANRSLILALAMTCACAVMADRVTLTNGRHLDGLIESESMDHVTLRIEGGTTRISRQRIARIDYSTPDDAKQIEEEWKRKYFLNEGYVPPGLADLANRLRALLDMRQQVVRARRSLDGAAAREAELRLEYVGLNDQLTAAGAQLRAMDPKQDVRAYNTAVTQINELRNATALKGDALRALPGLKQGWTDLIVQYTGRVEALRRDIARRHSGGGESDDERTFLNRALSEIATLSGEFETSTTSLHAHRAGHTVEVQINGTTTGRFVVDTGAAIVTMSESFAKRAGLVWDEADTIELVLANGKGAKGARIMLDHVAVGDVAARGVPAVILASGPDEDIDGLLGMSFLSRFQFSMEPGNGRLTLKDFVPGE